MLPIRLLVATLLLLAAPALAEPPPADPVIGWARVEFDANGITREEAGGYADLATMRPMTVDDPVRVASVSKLVVALGVLRLVEAGTLDLDADVSDYLGWTLRNPAFPDTPITLRHVLGHRSGIRDDAGYALPLDADLEEWMRQDGAWNHEHEPGEWFSYANLNFPVVAAAMEGATGERFDRIMHAQVFEPLGLDACFNWTTCSDEARSRAAVLYRADGEAIRDTQDFIATGCPATPASDGTCDLESYVLARNGAAFSPQGGLRISARDLARIGIVLMGWSGNESFAFLYDHFSSAGIGSVILGRTAYPISAGYGDGESGLYCRYDKGIHYLNHDNPECHDDLFGSQRLAWEDQQYHRGHSGEAYGLRSGLWADPGDEGQTGVAYFATGLPEESARPGNSAFTAIEERLAQGLSVETVVPEGGDGE
ncbi:serine hydrolase [uncultured Parasphingopyxis sp.]|uniref:serine hydrolase domain-containing protein n=1 Tax=uncultured Parasphingopyxis sp. TaxID=1547918 RepID=UPI00262F68ED|nr:serine hydrolase domain-containing protein [uncultured Parasphingopyxis sp.]